jgi:phage gp46-like protein
MKPDTWKVHHGHTLWAVARHNDTNIIELSPLRYATEALAYATIYAINRARQHPLIATASR